MDQICNSNHRLHMHVRPRRISTIHKCSLAAQREPSDRLDSLAGRVTATHTEFYSSLVPKTNETFFLRYVMLKFFQDGKQI